MKKIIIAAVLLVSTLSSAQVSFKPGVKGGFSSSIITGYGADYRNNFYLGAFGNLALGKMYNMQFELLYLRQGADNLQVKAFSNDGTNRQIKPTNVPLDYLSLNLINKFNFDKFNMQIGPGIDFKISENQIPTYPEGTGVYYDNAVYDINTGVDLTFNIGLGYSITPQLGIEARMRQGILEPIYANVGNYTSGSHLNRSFQVGITYMFK